ncbi:MAG: large repetitive protein [Verrucomicrobiota bacterium]|jgi:hypothetical protein
MTFPVYFTRLVLLLLLASASSGFGVTVTGVSPPMGSVGDGITISGSGFAPNGFQPTNLVVKLGLTTVTTDTNTVLSDNQISTQVPAGASSGQITVQINNPPASPGPQFTVISTNAYATNFSPIFGPNSGGTTVTINGAHFSSITNVSFNGKLGTGFNGAVIDQIQIISPAGVSTGPLILLSSYGSTHNFSTLTNTISTSTNFFVTPPIITAFSPATGRAGTNVVITGTNFLGATNVLFGGLNVGPGSFTVSNNNTIQLAVPISTVTGPLQISLMFPGGAGLITSTNFRMLPTISSFSPAFGPVGTTVIITGANLNEKSPPTVTFNGMTATVSGSSFSFITSTVPAGATSGPITVTTTNGSMTSGQIFYLPPAITSFTPTNSAPGTRVTITGSNFTNASSVTFNGVAASFNVTNNTTIGATVPNGVITGPISVTTPGGTATSSGNFYGAPIITDFNPKHGLPGTNVTITGTNFLGTTAVKFFNNINAVITSINNGQIVVTVPNGAQTGPITIVAPAGSTSTATSFGLDYTNNLVLLMSDAPDPVFVTSNLVYTLIITNLGPIDAPNVKLTNTLPASVLLKLASTTAGTLNTNNPANIIGTLGTVTNGGAATITFTVVPTATGFITNVARVAGDYPDPVPGNNSNSVVTVVFPLPLLSIQLVPTNLIQVSWPAPLSNFTLQFKNALSTNLPWTNVTAARTITITNVFVLETNAAMTRFYRLTN